LLKHPYDEQHVRFHFISDKVNLMPDFAASALETGRQQQRRSRFLRDDKKNDNDKCNSRSPSGMTTRKARAKARAKTKVAGLRGWLA
jgi:hypothetical protein